MLNLDYPQLLNLFEEHRGAEREDSAAFLIWYLENYYRLTTDEAVDAVCDKHGDKGVDGIFVNDNDQTITIFQSTIRETSDKTIGESPLSKFAGTLQQFETPESISALASSIGKDTRLSTLIQECDLESRVRTHELRGEFLSNVNLHPNGAAYLRSVPRITFVGKDTLLSTYISSSRDLPKHNKVSFDMSGYAPSVYEVEAGIKAVIAPVKATELVTLSGISDQSLYAHNVRGPLGKTKVNKDIVRSISDPSSHKLFPLFHNGITLIAKHLHLSKRAISVEDYFVVNGCQSLTALFRNKEKLTDDLRILTKFIQVEPDSDLARNVTDYSNNQNGVGPRDLMSNHPIQIRLQNEFREKYGGQYYFEIKRGDQPDPGEVISNEAAGLLMIAFDFKEPWTTHRTYRVFEEKYAQLFGRPEVLADRIVLCDTISRAVANVRPKIHNELFGKYRLTRYFLVYVVRTIVEEDPLFPQVTTHPEKFVGDAASRTHFRECIEAILNEVTVDLNLEIDELGKDFDYRGKLRDLDWVKDISKKLLSTHLKDILRKKAKSFSELWG